MQRLTRILKISPLALVFFSVCCVAQTAKPDDKPANSPTVNSNLVIQGLPVGAGYEHFRSLISAYLKEIEANGDYKNWKVAPSTAYERPR